MSSPLPETSFEVVSNVPERLARTVVANADRLT